MINISVTTKIQHINLGHGIMHWYNALPFRILIFHNKKTDQYVYQNSMATYIDQKYLFLKQAVCCQSIMGVSTKNKNGHYDEQYTPKGAKIPVSANGP